MPALPLILCVDLGKGAKTLQELRMLSSVTINCQVTKIVMNSGSQLSELQKSALLNVQRADLL